MLQIFWEIKEEAEIKKIIVDSLKNIENKLSLSLEKRMTTTVILTSSEKIKQINRTYRKKNKETDVLSFAELDLASGSRHAEFLQDKNSLGEIYINYNWIEKDKSPLRLALKLFIHGYLHLLGFDHEKDQGEMEDLEKKIEKEILI